MTDEIRTEGRGFSFTWRRFAAFCGAVLLVHWIFRELPLLFGRADDWRGVPVSIPRLGEEMIFPLLLLGFAGFVMIFRPVRMIWSNRTAHTGTAYGIVGERALGAWLLGGQIVIIAATVMVASALRREEFLLVVLSVGLIAFLTLHHVVGARAKAAGFAKGGWAVKVIGLLCLLGILAAISIPNFSKARRQASSRSGFSVGGAKDIDNFRRNVERGFLPQVTDLTYEGLFYDYFFDFPENDGPASGTTTVLGSGKEGPAAPPVTASEPTADAGLGRLFSPSCSFAVTNDPLGGGEERFVAVGLNSELDVSRVPRPALNLVIVLDISGSMAGGFSSYYYDPDLMDDPDSKTVSEAERIAEEELRHLDSKMKVATYSMARMLDHLKPGDRLGIVLFDHGAYLAKPMREVERTDMAALRGHILEIEPRGSTNMEAGLRMGYGLLEPFSGEDPMQRENRVIFLTDAMPNTGSLGESPLVDMAAKAAEKHCHTTFIGVGLDFNTRLIERMTKVKGANYYSILSAGQFKVRLDNEFEYMVNPLVFGLTVLLESKRYRIEAVYGSPEAELSTGKLMRVNTLFPAPADERGVKGGVILVKLKPAALPAGGPGSAEPSSDSGVPGDRPSDDITLSVLYADRADKVHRGVFGFVFPSAGPPAYDNTAVRKAVALTRYCRTLREWLEKVSPGSGSGNEGYGQWERDSSPLAVPGELAVRFGILKNYLALEAAAVGDRGIDREIAVLDRLIACGEGKKR